MIVKVIALSLKKVPDFQERMNNATLRSTATHSSALSTNKKGYVFGLAVMSDVSSFTADAEAESPVFLPLTDPSLPFPLVL